MFIALTNFHLELTSLDGRAGLTRTVAALILCTITALATSCGSDATADELEHAKKLAESVNKHDDPDCDTGPGTGSRARDESMTLSSGDRSKGNSNGKKGKA